MLVNTCSRCQESEESADLILIHSTVKNLLLEWKFKGLDKKSRHVKEWCPYGCSGAYGKSETQNLQWRRACKSEVKGELH
ncbi:hypothetical protein CK203_095999 [Vitis vinifera]|uniref:Uncharacterized protein n=1 Tax=Vitis vinifera TaxID=29760 RepID=A0A438FCC4_VITVI|nr:hypothetical protein CK203_095999 [Vitis vinifera]